MPTSATPASARTKRQPLRWRRLAGTDAACHPACLADPAAGSAGGIVLHRAAGAALVVGMLPGGAGVAAGQPAAPAGVGALATRGVRPLADAGLVAGAATVGIPAGLRAYLCRVTQCTDRASAA